MNPANCPTLIFNDGMVRIVDANGRTDGLIVEKRERDAMGEPRWVELKEDVLWRDAVKRAFCAIGANMRVQYREKSGRQESTDENQGEPG